jgi:hypothetical protein
VLWHLHGDPAEVLPILHAALSLTGGSPYNPDTGPPLGAIELAPELGPAAGPLVPLLRTTLPDRTSWKRVAVVEALWRLDAMDTDTLVATLLPTPRGRPWLATGGAERALDLLCRARATAAVPLLEQLLTRDERFEDVSRDAQVRHDEHLCRRLRAAITELTP